MAPAAAAAGAAARAGASSSSNAGRPGGSVGALTQPPLLGVDPKKIRGDEELRRIFGAGVIEAVDRMEGECLMRGICFRGVSGVSNTSLGVVYVGWFFWRVGGGRGVGGVWMWHWV
jgi:hypothetical protein